MTRGSARPDLGGDSVLSGGAATGSKLLNMLKVDMCDLQSVSISDPGDKFVESVSVLHLFWIS